MNTLEVISKILNKIQEYIMPKIKKKPIEIDINKLKALEMFESTPIDIKAVGLGYSAIYTRVPGGIIRLVIHPSAASQILIPFPNSFFVSNKS